MGIAKPVEILQWTSVCRSMISSREGVRQVARNLLNAGESIDRVVMVTGLSREEIESLLDANQSAPDHIGDDTNRNGFIAE